MEKKIRYLMLLLCLCLFPMKAFALENSLEDTNKEVDNVVVENISNNENLDNENLVKIDNPNDVLLEDVESNNKVSNTLMLTKSPAEDPTASVEDNTTKDVENLESDNKKNSVEDPTNDPEDPEDPKDPEEPEIVELTELLLTNVNTNLVVGEDIIFSGQSTETDKYTIVREEWTLYANVDKIITSDAAYNSSLPAGTLLDTLEEGYDYEYSFLLQIKEGYRLAEDFIVSIDGTRYVTWYNSQTGVIYVSLQAQAKSNDAQYIDSLDLVDVVKDAVVGKKPTFGAKSTTDHVSLFGERWWYYYIDQNNGDYYYFANATDPSLVYDDEELFDAFEANRHYIYEIVVVTDAGYRLNFESGSDYAQKYNITINGEVVDLEVYNEILEDGSARYYICVAEDIVPIEEQVEESPVYDEEPVATVISYDNTYEENTYVEPTATLLIEKTNEDTDNKLEVKKDTKNKEATKEEKDKSNVGLIVFLIILIAIAIAIPITVYKKKQ